VSESIYTYVTPVTVVDASGAVCPGPVVAASRAVRAVALGEVIRLIATDPGCRRDIPAWCSVIGHELLGSSSGADGSHWFLIRRSH
jgi:tRNA 2-thiouridine synthesizing protein A